MMKMRVTELAIQLMTKVTILVCSLYSKSLSIIADGSVTGRGCSDVETVCVDENNIKSRHFLSKFKVRICEIITGK